MFCCRTGDPPGGGCILNACGADLLQIVGSGPGPRELCSAAELVIDRAERAC